MSELTEGQILHLRAASLDCEVPDDETMSDLYRLTKLPRKQILKAYRQARYNGSWPKGKNPKKRPHCCSNTKASKVLATSTLTEQPRLCSGKFAAKTDPSQLFTCKKIGRQGDYEKLVQISIIVESSHVFNKKTKYSLN
jgi:hypothetical protein